MLHVSEHEFTSGRGTCDGYAHDRLTEVDLKSEVVRWWSRRMRPGRRFGIMPNRAHLRRGIRRRGHLPNVRRHTKRA